MFFVVLILSVVSLIVLERCTVKASCPIALDIVQVQDMTSSFDGLWGQMEQQVDTVRKIIDKTNGESYFGMLTFGDKNISGTYAGRPNKPYYLGYKSDYCARVDVPLGPYNSSKMKYIFTEYSKTFSGGGGDWPEASIEAVYRALLSSQVKWRDAKSEKKFIGKVVVLVTDATSHVDGDVLKFTSHSFPNFNLPSPLEDENEKCSTMEYPSFKAVADKIIEEDAQLIVLVTPGGQYDDEGNFRVTYSLASQGAKYKHVNGLQLWYKDKFEQAGLKNVIIQELDHDMKAYAASLEKALKHFVDIGCTPEPQNETTEPVHGDDDDDVFSTTVEIKTRESTKKKSSTTGKKKTKTNKGGNEEKRCETSYLVDVDAVSAISA